MYYVYKVLKKKYKDVCVYVALTFSLLFSFYFLYRIFFVELLLKIELHGKIKTLTLSVFFFLIFDAVLLFLITR